MAISGNRCHNLRMLLFEKYFDGDVEFNFVFSDQVGMAAFDLRSASLHLSQYIETSSSYQNTKTLMRFYDPSVIIVPPNKLAADGMVGVSELVDRCYSTVRKVKVSLPWIKYFCTNWRNDCICL